MEDKMNIYEKLVKLKVDLQAKNLKKTGKNKHNGTIYFEMADFLPSALILMKELKLCSFISFGREEARLTLIDTETGDQISITSQNAKAALKGCHDIQNAGAEQTYQRRYLYINLLDIVETDILDHATNYGEAKPKSPKATEKEELDEPPFVGELDNCPCGKPFSEANKTFFKKNPGLEPLCYPCGQKKKKGEYYGADLVEEREPGQEG